MYSTCLFCHAPLGANEVVERFPVGRRLAFDAAKGRLWVVCTACRRWNLTPMEERWEAVEQCERLFRDAKLRASTDNVGLVRLGEGLDLVRIGRPARSELALWRYGAELMRRRRRAATWAAASVAVSGAVVVGGLAGVVAAGLPMVLAMTGLDWLRAFALMRPQRMRGPDGELLKVRLKDWSATRLIASGGGGWVLRVPHKAGRADFRGAPALRTAGVLLARIHAHGGTSQEVRDAVAALERFRDPVAYVSGVVTAARDSGVDTLGGLPGEVRLALEIAAGEDVERRALEGELAELEVAWREAEEIAAIADSLLLPASVTDALRRLRPGRADG